MRSTDVKNRGNNNMEQPLLIHGMYDGQTSRGQA
jgi:hypothetical protein